MSTTQQAERIATGRYIYRGIHVSRVRHVPSGYRGAWEYTVKSAGEFTVFKTHSLKAAKQAVDELLN